MNHNLLSKLLAGLQHVIITAMSNPKFKTEKNRPFAMKYSSKIYEAYSQIEKSVNGQRPRDSLPASMAQ